MCTAAGGVACAAPAPKGLPAGGARPARAQDAPIGIKAAAAAGMPAVLVPDPNLDVSKVLAAAAVLGSLDEFDPAAWGLPPFAVLN